MSPENHPIYSASDRIKQLNGIDKDIAQLLHSAGLAIKALTVSTASAPLEGQPSQSSAIEQQKESFTTTTTQYFTLLSSVDVNLRRQLYALEEADILPAEAVSNKPTTSLAVPSAVQAHPQNPSLPRVGGGNKGVITGGGLGNLDVGWLNSRNDHVGKEMKSELWREAETFVRKLEDREPGVDQKLDLLKGNGQEAADVD